MVGTARRRAFAQPTVIATRRSSCTIRIGSGAGYSGDRIEPAVAGEVVRCELPNIAALNFVMTAALGGGVTRSLALDAHGKSLSSALLELEIEDELGP
jgi:hypothetical protein